ncbi:TetR/AcrR family transcriptional regulator [Lactobacillaceae bacterium 24-114]
MRVTRTVRDFQNALLTLLESNSFERLTVDQICKEALLHRSSFYRYFRDKYDLLEQTLNAQLNQLIDKSDTEDDLIQQLIYYVGDHKNIFRHLASEDAHSSLYVEMMRIINQIMMERRQEKSDDLIIKLLQEADDPEMLAYGLSGALIGVFYWWQSKNYDVALDKVVEFAKRSIQSLSVGQQVEKN